MTKQEKIQIKQLRLQGLGYGKIAQILNFSKSTVSSFCKSLEEDASVCLMCDVKLKQTTGHRQKKYCSEKCKHSYWRLHKDEIKRKPTFEVECAYCHKKFLTYKCLHRKYCSWDCFSISRMKRTANG